MSIKHLSEEKFRRLRQSIARKCLTLIKVLTKKKDNREIERQNKQKVIAKLLATTVATAPIIPALPALAGGYYDSYNNREFLQADLDYTMFDDRDYKCIKLHLKDIENVDKFTIIRFDESTNQSFGDEYIPHNDPVYTLTPGHSYKITIIVHKIDGTSYVMEKHTGVIPPLGQQQPNREESNRVINNNPQNTDNTYSQNRVLDSLEELRTYDKDIFLNPPQAKVYKRVGSTDIIIRVQPVPGSNEYTVEVIDKLDGNVKFHERMSDLSKDIVFHGEEGHRYTINLISYTNYPNMSGNKYIEIDSPISERNNTYSNEQYNGDQSGIYNDDSQSMSQYSSEPNTITITGTRTQDYSEHTENRTTPPSVNVPMLPSPTIMMPDAEGTVFYCKDTQSFTFNWNRVDGAEKYKITIYDLTRDNGNAAINEYVSSYSTSYTFGILGAHKYKIVVSAVDSYNRESQSEYTVDEGRLVTRDLYQGCAKGRDVQILHQKLNDLGLNTGLNSGAYDEYFRPQTDTAVKAVQLFMGQKVDGKVGNNTWWSINTLTKEMNQYMQHGNYDAQNRLIDSLKNCWIEMSATKTELRKNMTGEEVKVLQRKLNELGLYTGGIDGNFGDETRISVRAIQRACGIPDTGVVDKSQRGTWFCIQDQLEIKKYDDNAGIDYFRNQGKWIRDAREQIVREEEESKAAEAAHRSEIHWAASNNNLIDEVLLPTNSEIVISKTGDNITLESIMQNLYSGSADTVKDNVNGIKEVFNDPVGSLSSAVEVMWAFSAGNYDSLAMIKRNEIINSVSDQIASGYNEFTQGNWNVKAYYVSRVGSEVVLIL